MSAEETVDAKVFLVYIVEVSNKIIRKLKGTSDKKHCAKKTK